MLQVSSVLLLHAAFAAQTHRADANASICAAQDVAHAAHGPAPSFDVSIVVPPSLATAEDGCTDSGVRFEVRARPTTPSAVAPERLCIVLVLWRGPHALDPKWGFPCAPADAAPNVCFDAVGEYALFAWVESADGATRLSQVTAVSVLWRGAAAVAQEAHPRLVADDPRRAFTEFSFSEMRLLRKIFDRRPLLVELEDKLRARDFAAALGVATPRLLLPPQETATGIPFDRLPRTGFVIKPNHWSGEDSVRIFRGDGAEVTRLRGRRVPGAAAHEPSAAALEAANVPPFARPAVRQIDGLLGLSFSERWLNGEWSLGQVQPRRVLVEEVVERGTLAEDYKCHCFNGRTHFAQIDFSRHGSNDSHTQALFDREGRLTPFRMVEFVTPADPVAAVAHRVGDDEWAALVAACDRLAGPVHDYIRVDFLRRVLEDGSSEFLLGEFTTSSTNPQPDDALNWLLGALWSDPPWLDAYLRAWGP